MSPKAINIQMQCIRIKLIVVLQIFFITLNAQDAFQDHSGKYNYSIFDIPYGDFFGQIILTKNRKHYQGEIINEEGIKYRLKGVRIEGNKITFKSDVEEVKSAFTCEILGDAIYGSVKVVGDDFQYVLRGKKFSE